MACEVAVFFGVNGADIRPSFEHFEISHTNRSRCDDLKKLVPVPKQLPSGCEKFFPARTGTWLSVCGVLQYQFYMTMIIDAVFWAINSEIRLFSRSNMTHLA